MCLVNDLLAGPGFYSWGALRLSGADVRKWAFATWAGGKYNGIFSRSYGKRREANFYAIARLRAERISGEQLPHASYG